MVLEVKNRSAKKTVGGKFMVQFHPVPLYGRLTFSGFPGTCKMIKDEGCALLLCCGLEPAQRRITAFSRPQECM